LKERPKLTTERYITALSRRLKSKYDIYCMVFLNR